MLSQTARGLSQRNLMEDRLPDMGVPRSLYVTADLCSEPPHELKTSHPSGNDCYLRPHQSITTLPELPLFIASKPSM